MSDRHCSYPGREEMLMGYLYGEIGMSERRAFEAHLGPCDACRRELEGLGVVRERLGRWAPPEPQVLSAPGWRARESAGHWWQEMPVWTQVAAALLFLGVSAGVANLDVKYDRDGLAVRTGWSAPVVAAPAVEPAGSQPWRADLADLDAQLRAEMRATGERLAAAVQPASERRVSEMSEAELLQRVKVLIDQSERKEQSELALRVAEMFRDVQAQRQADLAKIDRSLGLIQNNTGFEVRRNRELLNSLAVRVSQTR